MHWENERYVRLYTRDTADWLALSFDAQALCALLLRKVDRDGCMPLGRHGRKAVAICLGQAAIWDRLSAALAELEADGCVVVEGPAGAEVLRYRNYVEAQEAVASGAQRTREWRERKRLEESPGVTDERRDVTGARRSVTGGDGARRSVTPASQPSQPSVPAEPASSALARELRVSEQSPGMVNSGQGQGVGGAVPSGGPTPEKTPAPPPREPWEELRSSLEQSLAITGRRLLVAKSRPGEPDRTAEIKASLNAAIAVLGPAEALELCRLRALDYHAERSRYPSSLAYFVGPLGDAAEAQGPPPPDPGGGYVPPKLGEPPTPYHEVRS